MEGAGKLRNSKVEFMWVVGGWWYERIAVTVRLRLSCYEVFLGVDVVSVTQCSSVVAAAELHDVL